MMPLLRVNLIDGELRVAGRTDPDQVIACVLAGLPVNAPVILMVHGFKSSPASLRHSPHRHVLSLEPMRKGARVVSWPRRLGFGRGDPAEGLCIAIGWHARGTIWQAYAEAGRNGEPLARLIAHIGQHHDGPTGLLAHSLGARVALSALPHLPEGALRRTVLLSGAELADRALDALDTPAGRTAEIVNIVSRENDLFDLLLEGCLRPHDRAARAIGSGLGVGRPGWLDLAVDDPANREALRGLGFPLPPPLRAICHRSGYLRPGMFALHRALLRMPDRFPLALLRDRLPQARDQARIRLVDSALWSPPLPQGFRTPT